MRKPISVAVLVVLTVTAGCQGFVPGASGSGSPTPTPTPPTAETDAQSSGTAPGGGPTATLDVSAGAANSSRIDVYDRLYRQTIGSVVKIKVVHATGSVGTGSGFVYDGKGRIVTNHHVVKNAETVMVRFRNGEWRRGTVVGSDVYSDLAVVDVDDVPRFADPLPVADRRVQPGDPVVALGSPFGLEGTITHGIVSGVNRSMATSLGFTIPDTIQTDAPINPGNSGGPLLSLNGTVVGVNRATRGDNVGFAISATVLERVVPALIETGSFHHPYLGVRTATVTPVIAAANDLAAARGVVVTRLLPSSPAGDTLRPASQRYTESGRAIPVGGDVILRVDSRTIHSRQALARYLLLQTRPGETVTLVVLRDGERRKVTVELARRPEYGSA
ncbi:MAG: S1C family serine protease [Haloarculaceae archaeon]